MQLWNSARFIIRILVYGKDISKLTPQDRVREGISFVPQTRNVFTGLSVEENLEMGAFLREERIEEIISEIYELFPILKEKNSQITSFCYRYFAPTYIGCRN